MVYNGIYKWMRTGGTTNLGNNHMVYPIMKHRDWVHKPCFTYDNPLDMFHNHIIYDNGKYVYVT